MVYYKLEDNIEFFRIEVIGNGELYCYVGIRIKFWLFEKGGSVFDCWVMFLELFVYIYKYKV